MSSGRNPLRVRRSRRNSWVFSDSAMKTDYEKPPPGATERAGIRVHQPNSHFVVEVFFLRGHRVLEQFRLTINERHVKELLGLAAKCPLKDTRESATEFERLVL